MGDKNGPCNIAWVRIQFPGLDELGWIKVGLAELKHVFLEGHRGVIAPKGTKGMAMYEMDEMHPHLTLLVGETLRRMSLKRQSRWPGHLLVRLHLPLRNTHAHKWDYTKVESRVHVSVWLHSALVASWVGGDAENTDNALWGVVTPLLAKNCEILEIPNNIFSCDISVGA